MAPKPQGSDANNSGMPKESHTVLAIDESSRLK